MQTMQIATRCYQHTQLGTTDPFNSRTFHYARDNVQALQIAIPNWYGAGSTWETPSGGVTTVTASIEYPVNTTFTQLKFSGSATGTIASGATLFSDMVAVTIPAGALFFVRMFLSNTVGITYNDAFNFSPLFGDALDDTGVDLTLGGTIVDGFAGTIGILPVAICGPTNRTSICVIGDSRNAGTGDTTPDATGEQGQASRALAGQVAMINLCVPGSFLANFLAGNTQSSILAKKCTVILGAHGINELVITPSATPAQLEAEVLQLQELYAPRPYYHGTLAPFTTGAWTNPTGSDQTINPGDINRTTFNTWVRAKSQPLTGFFEFDGPVEMGGVAAGNGLWNAPGFTADGIHPTTLADLTLVATAPPTVLDLIFNGSSF
jgi:hypothetical protein